VTDAELAAAIDAILAWEGTGFTPGDPAAGDPPTKAGIIDEELGRWRRLGRKATAEELAAMPLEEARDIYRAWYIVGPHFDCLTDSALRQAIIDFGVNSGTDRAAWYLQKAAGVTPDMLVGPLTLAAVAAANPLELLARVTRARVEVLVRWIRARPAARGAYAAVITRAVSHLPEMPGA
jgi:lysozyme family protein